MKRVKRSAGVGVSRCFYCGAGLLKGEVRLIVVNGLVVAVHRRHPRRAGEVSA